MYQLFLKTNIVLIILLYNFLSLASLEPKNSHRKHQKQKGYLYKLRDAEKIYNTAIKKETPLNKVLTKKQLLMLADRFFNQSLPQSPLICTSLYENYENNGKTPHQEVDLLQKDRLIIFKALPQQIAHKEIHNQLQQIKEGLLNDEYKTWENLITTFAKKYNFDSSIALSSYDDLKNLTQELLKKKHANTIHNEALPENWIEYIKNAMEKKGLNINNINLFILKNENALATCLNASINKPGIISLCKYYLKFRQIIDLEFIANHEVTHLASGHGIIRWCVSSYIKEQIIAHAKKNTYIDNEIRKSPAYTSLLLAQERTADILCALDDYNSAAIAYKYLSTYFDCGYSGSYNYAAIINANWKALDLLTKLSKS